MKGWPRLIKFQWKTIRQRLWSIAVSVSVVLLPAAICFAQTEEADPNTGVQVIARSYVVDILVLIVLVGAALFAVCRSSNRS